MTLRVPDEARDADSFRHFENPEIVRRILGGPQQPHDSHPVFAQQLEWWRAGTNAVFSIDAEGHTTSASASRV